MKKYNIGISFGGYDCFHIGHLNLIKQAKSLCKKLIVCVSDDDYIKSVKGHAPMIPLCDRIKILESIKYIDKVGIQSPMLTKKINIQNFKPKVIFVGDDWTPETFSGEGLGLPVLYLKRTPMISSTFIREKLQGENNA